MSFYDAAVDHEVARAMPAFLLQPVPDGGPLVRGAFGEMDEQRFIELERLGLSPDEIAQPAMRQFRGSGHVHGVAQHQLGVVLDVKKIVHLFYG